MADKRTKQNTPTLVTAHARDLRIAPRKMRLVTNLVKGRKVQDALVQLQFTNKKGAPFLVKLLKSAMANAEHNFSLEPSNLYIRSITCSMGKTMSRYFPRARGSAAVIRRKMAHVSVVLESKEVPGAKKSRFSMLARSKKPKEQDEKQISQELPPGKEAAGEGPVHPVHTKTGEQIKANKIQQKRRLFNRKSGE